MTDNNEIIWVEIEQRINTTTTKAVLAGSVWLPKSQIECYEIYIPPDETKHIVDSVEQNYWCHAIKMKAWLAKENNLKELENF